MPERAAVRVCTSRYNSYSPLVHADAAVLAALLERGRQTPLRRMPDIDDARAEELVRAVRGGRARR